MFLDVWTILRNLVGDLHLGIEVADPLLGFVPYPLAVIPHVLGEPLGTLPFGQGLFLL